MTCILGYGWNQFQMMMSGSTGQSKILARSVLFVGSA